MISSGTRLGPYEIVSAIGAGGMGEVYRARDTKLNREVAVKVLPEEVARNAERMSRFEREAKVLASLNHPNIASIHGFEDSGSVHALVMELVEGQTLADRIAKGPIPLDEALPLAKQICEGLEYAHERGIVHRDLKPANIKLTPDGAVKILDFGLAKAMEAEAVTNDPSTSPTLSHLATQAGIILGTAAYMSPEQAKGKTVDRRADIWAFGCVLFEMLTGKQVFTGETITDVLAAVVRAEPEWSQLPANTPPAIRHLLARCLKKEAKQRLRDIGDARIAIEEAQSGAAQDSGALPSAGVTLVRPAGWRRALPWMLLGGALALAFGLGAAYFGRRAEAPRVLRFVIDPPENSQSGTALAISPDGTRLTFVATTNGKQMLWLRPFDSVQSQPIAGTEDGDFPFWSPDSKSIGFFANSELKRVDLDTMSVSTLCDVSAGNSRGGAWGPDGTILFAPGITQPLMKIAAGGGTPAPATVFDAAREDRSHRWPFFLPDGRHFLFLDERSGGAAAALEVGSLDSPKTQTILSLPSGSSVIYCAGFLIYSQAGSLVAQPFDADHLKITGSAVPIAPNVSPAGTVGPTGYVAVSATARGLLAYRNSVPLVSQLTLVDRGGRTLGTVGPVSGYSDPALSPDRNRVAVSIPDSGDPGVSSLWIVEVASGTMTRLTFDKDDNILPIWSPDGRWIYFDSNASGAYNIFRKRADGSGKQEHVRPSANIETPLDISRDGRYLLFSDLATGTNDDIWYMPLESPDKATVFLRMPARELDARFSPDGRWVAYRSDENNPGDLEVFVAPFPPNGSKWQVSSNGGYWPVWSDDGQQLYYVSGSTLMAVDVTAGAALQFRPPHPLFSIRPPEDYLDVNADYSVFPGGQKFLLNQLVTTGDKLPITVVSNWTEELKRR